MRNQLLFPISESSQVGDARRKTVELAKGAGFCETETEKAAIIVTELASNLIKHAGGGSLLAQIVTQGNANGLELISLDKGPGITNLTECFQDGYSTVGSQGQGLGAINRLASFFDIYSQSGMGTVQLAQLWEQPLTSNPPNAQFKVGAVCQPKRGEIACGDAWAVIQQPNRCLLLVADGLGHGPDAATAARQAVQVFEANPNLPPARVLELIHLALRPTRGAAVAVAEISAGQVKFAGIGNIAGSVISPTKEVRHMVSHNGIAGHEARKFQEFSYLWAYGASLVLHSDGLNTRFRTEAYPGMTVRHPSLMAGILFRDFDRKTDDATVVVVKES